MSKASEHIAADIRLKRKALLANVEALQAKVRSVTDWRQQFERHPVMMTAAAVGAGALLATLVGGTERRRDPPDGALAADGPARPRPSSDRSGTRLARRVWEPLQEALIDIAVLRVTEMLERKPRSSTQPPAGDGPDRQRAEPQSDDSAQTEPSPRAAERAAARYRDAETDESLGPDPLERAPRETASQEMQSRAAVGAAARRAGSRTRLE